MYEQFDTVSYNDRAVMIPQLREIFMDPEANLGPELAAHLYKMGVLNKWEFEFSIGTAVQETPLSPKQIYWRLKTHMKILDEFEIAEVQHGMKLLIALKRMKGSINV